jgi:hypothetical protein
MAQVRKSSWDMRSSGIGSSSKFTLFLEPRLRSRSRSRGRGGYRPPMTTGCGGGGLYQRFRGGGGRLVTPQFQHGGPMISVVHEAHWHSGRCL